jgi:hypothetical protein
MISPDLVPIIGLCHQPFAHALALYSFCGIALYSVKGLIHHNTSEIGKNSNGCHAFVDG